MSTHPAGHNAQVPAIGGNDKQALDEIEAAIAVASHDLGLLPAVTFQSRVAQLAQLMDTHQTVCTITVLSCYYCSSRISNGSYSHLPVKVPSHSVRENELSLFT